MKIFYFQAKKELQEKDRIINLLTKANNAMMEELKAANDKLNRRKKKKEQNEKKDNGDINTIL